MGCRDAAGENGGHDQGRVTYIHNDGGEFFGGQGVNDALFLQVNADGDENANHAHLLQDNG